ncbi:hypothetical protein NDU88_001464 [Pleurodeles waltl]|uniref:Uncharacterized protein n=1 Tax=Pleurodeles waltl TaxID=8319 RepID=A0AAV7P3U6_PLEWA|nr:hypothetical protein NDU88_001464 [Pleurodeles waltl]
MDRVGPVIVDGGPMTKSPEFRRTDRLTSSAPWRHFILPLTLRLTSGCVTCHLLLLCSQGEAQPVLSDWAVSRTNGRYFSHLCGKKTQLRDPDCWAIFSPVCAKIAAGRRRRRYWCETRHAKRKKKDSRAQQHCCAQEEGLQPAGAGTWKQAACARCAVPVARAVSQQGLSIGSAFARY